MSKPLSPLAAQVRRIMLNEGMASPGETVLVAVSGGGDSMALLCLLLEGKEALGISVHAAHYDHGLRGTDAKEDARFVKDFCRERGIPCHMGAGDVRTLAAAWHCSLEDGARRARYAFLEETAQAIGAGKIALAHQLEDQAETLLLHLIHGAGLRGLSAMRPLSGMRIRPLLSIPKAALLAYLGEKGIPHREDHTNQDPAYRRNYLRHQVFPLLAAMNPRVWEAMARAAAHAARGADVLEAQAEQFLQGRVKAMPYGAFLYLGDHLPTAEALRRFAAVHGVPPLDEKTSMGMVCLGPGDMLNLPGGCRALRTRERLHLVQREDAPPTWQETDFTQKPGMPGDYGDGVRVQAFDGAALQGAVFRRRQPGDVFAPLGGGTQKLKQALGDGGIDRPFRDLLPILARGNRVLWIVGIKPSRDGAVSPDTKEIITYRFNGELPWEIKAMQEENL